MPFLSKSQRRACYAAHDPNWDCGEWESETPSNLPERVKKKKKKHEQYSFASYIAFRESNLIDQQT